MAQLGSLQTVHRAVIDGRPFGASVIAVGLPRRHHNPEYMDGKLTTDHVIVLKLWKMNEQRRIEIKEAKNIKTLLTIRSMK